MLFVVRLLYVNPSVTDLFKQSKSKQSNEAYTIKLYVILSQTHTFCIQVLKKKKLNKRKKQIHHVNQAGFSSHNFKWFITQYPTIDYMYDTLLTSSPSLAAVCSAKVVHKQPITTPTLC